MVNCFYNQVFYGICPTFCFYSIAEYSVENSIIKPTYMLTHESASELLHLDLAEEIDLKLLSEAANLRLKWRCQQVDFREYDKILYEAYTSKICWNVLILMIL